MSYALYSRIYKSLFFVCRILVLRLSSLIFLLITIIGKLFDFTNGSSNSPSDQTGTVLKQINNNNNNSLPNQTSFNNSYSSFSPTLPSSSDATTTYGVIPSHLTDGTASLNCGNPLFTNGTSSLNKVSEVSLFPTFYTHLVCEPCHVIFAFLNMFLAILNSGNSNRAQTLLRRVVAPC